jgi:hypothetical protein
LAKVVPFLVEDEMMRLSAPLQGQELGRSHGDRWTVDHRPESGFIGSGCQASDRCAEQEGELGQGRRLEHPGREEAWLRYPLSSPPSATKVRLTLSPSQLEEAGGLSEHCKEDAADSAQPGFGEWGGHLRKS